MSSHYDRILVTVQNTHGKKESCVWGMCTAFFLIYGYAFHHQYEDPLLNPVFFGLFIILTILLSGIAWWAMNALRRRYQYLGRTMTISKRKTRNMITAAILCVGWTPYWLAGYPGFFTYDATNAFIQHFYGISYSTHHPLLHSILIADVFKVMLRFFPENYNAGIVALSWLTMLMGAIVFTYMLDYIYSISDCVVHGVGVAYLAFFPTIGLFSSCSTKDTYSAFWMILFITKLLKLNRKTDGNGTSQEVQALQIRNCIVLVFFIGMMLLYRKNIIIAYVIFVPIFLLIMKNNRVRWVLIFAAGLCLYMIGNGFLEYRYHPVHGAVSEMLCVPFQQMGRVYVEEGDAMFTSEEKAFFDSFYSYSLAAYHELNADYVKHDIDDEKLRDNLWAFLKMWFRIGIHHPVEYIEAFLVNTYQAWYPFCNITGYAPDSDSAYTYFKCSVERPGVLDSKIPRFYDLLWSLSRETSLYEIPVVGIFFPIGIYLIMNLFVFCYGVFVKNKYMVIFTVFMLSVAFTALCGPLVLPRYYIYLYYTFPLIIGFLRCNKQRFQAG